MSACTWLVTCGARRSVVLCETSTALVSADVLEHNSHFHAQPQSYNPARSASRDLVSLSTNQNSTTVCTFGNVRPGLQPSTWQTCGPHPSPQSLPGRSYSTPITTNTIHASYAAIVSIHSLHNPICPTAVAPVEFPFPRRLAAVANRCMSSIFYFLTVWNWRRQLTG